MEQQGDFQSREPLADRFPARLKDSQDGAEDRLRTFAQWLLVVPVVMIGFFACAQLALYSSDRVTFFKVRSAPSADYRPWKYLPNKSFRENFMSVFDDGDNGHSGVPKSLESQKPAAWIEITPTAQHADTDLPTGDSNQRKSGSPTASPLPTIQPTHSPATATSTATELPPPTATPAMSPTHTPQKPTPTPTSAPTATPTSWGDWWDPAYAYRRQLTIVPSSEGLPDGYTLRLAFDHGSLMMDGKARGNGEDVRILYKEPAGWVELDRVIDDDAGWGREDSAIFFPLQVPLDSKEADGSYYLYYGNSNATAPPVDPNRVFWYFSDFATSNALADWTSRDVHEGSEWSISKGGLRQTRNGEQNHTDPQINSKLLLTARSTIRDLDVELDYVGLDNDLTAVGLCTNDESPQGFYIAWSRDHWFDADDQDGRVGYWVDSQHNGFVNISYESENVYEFRARWTSQQIEGSFAGTNFDWAAGPSSPGSFCFALNAMEGVFLDNLILRRFVNPEPGISLGSEEQRP